MEIIQEKNTISPGIQQEKKSDKRALALDALRGLAILGMILSGRVPADLPAWMFHAQVPHHKVNLAIPGITWVDLVFPFFLFAMGAAFPFALSKKLDEGVSKTKIIIGIVQRTFLLFFFAIILQHFSPYSLSKTTDYLTHVFSFLIFLLMFMLYFRYPKTIKTETTYILKGLGILGLIILLALVVFPNGKGFSLYKSNIIVLVLANMSLYGSIIWLFTRKSILLRLSILPILAAFLLLGKVEGNWVNYIYTNFQIPWFTKIYYMKYLFIVLPGTIAGDIFLEWMNKKDEYDNIAKTAFNRRYQWTICFILILAVSIITAGLFSRNVVEVTIFSFLLCIGGLFLFKNANTSFEVMLKKLFQWGSYWLILGLFLEPFEGGIKKDTSTFSYYFTTTALAIFLLISFSVLLNSLGKKFILQFLVESGQNPMLAYAAGVNLIGSLLFLTYLEDLLKIIAITPWLGFIKALLVTMILGFIVKYFTIKRMYWRS